MLQVTSTAAMTLESARVENGLPEGFGVRISAVANGNRGSYQFGFVEEPQAGDQVKETEGPPIFVAPEVAAPLDNAVLDVEDSGRLVLTPKAGDGTSV